MKRVWVLLVLLLPARAGALWALPRCAEPVVCHMGPDGESCCPTGECSMQECNRPDPGVVLAPAPSLPPVSAVIVPGPEPSEEAVGSAAFLPLSAPRDVLDPPPRARS